MDRGEKVRAAACFACQLAFLVDGGSKLRQTGQVPPVPDSRQDNAKSKSGKVSWKLGLPGCRSSIPLVTF
jgi:hypothetical protein